MEYTVRKPKATDLFVASKIIKGIGLTNIIDCFKSEKIKGLVKKTGNYTDEEVTQAGIVVLTNIADLIFEKLDIVQDDLIKFISNLTGLTVKQVEDLAITDFAEIVMTIIKEPDFVDFIKVVLKSFN